VITTSDKQQQLYGLLSRMKPFSGLQTASLQRLRINKVISRRGEILLPEQGSLLVVLCGRSVQIDEGHDGKLFQSAEFGPGDVIGWWPIDQQISTISHNVETHYIEIAPGWADDEALSAFAAQKLLQRLNDVHKRMVLSLTTTVAERVQYFPRRPGESNTELARRLGCSREILSKVFRTQ
jgi:hypothetical protein